MFRTLALVFALGAFFQPTLAAAACDRIEVVDGIYTMQKLYRVTSGPTLLACDCAVGDELVAGGCFIDAPSGFNDRLLSNGPGRQDGAWRWYCEPTFDRQPTSYSADVTVRILCKARP